MERLKAKGVRAIAVQSDQADLSSARPLVDTVLAEFGRLDILVNNAGIAIQGQTVDDPTLDWDAYNRQWQVNVLGTIANTRAAAPRLSDGGLANLQRHFSFEVAIAQMREILTAGPAR